MFALAEVTTDGHAAGPVAFDRDTVIGLRAEPLAVSRVRIARLRSVMPDESPIDLDEHAALIAYEVERRVSDRTLLKQQEARIGITRAHVRDVRRFIDELRHVLPS